jgi:hypothetical protein
MTLFISILFWLGIVFLTDGSLGLLFHEKWKNLTQGIDIQRGAWVEIALGITLLGLHYFCGYFLAEVIRC